MNAINRAIEIIKKNNGTIRTAEAIRAGISVSTFYRMRDQGIIISLSRGLYRLSHLPGLSNPDLITVSRRVPKAVICLISALNYYNLTEQIPHFIYIALPRESEMPRMDYPPLKITWLTKKAYQAGIENVPIENFYIKMYSPEKTITDCFKFRNKYGLDVAIDALKRYLALPASKQDFDSLMRFARLNRVEKIITPYIESLQ